MAFVGVEGCEINHTFSATFPNVNEITQHYYACETFMLLSITRKVVAIIFYLKSFVVLQHEPRNAH